MGKVKQQESKIKYQQKKLNSVYKELISYKNYYIEHIQIIDNQEKIIEQLRELNGEAGRLSLKEAIIEKQHNKIVDQEKAIKELLKRNTDAGIEIAREKRFAAPLVKKLESRESVTGEILEFTPFWETEEAKERLKSIDYNLLDIIDTLGGR